MSKLDEILDIEPEKTEEESKDLTIIEQTDAIPGASTDIEADYELARKTFQNLIETGNQSLIQLSQIAKNTEMPRAYECIAQLIKTMAETTTDFYGIQKTKKAIQYLDKNQQQGIQVDKAVFVGTTAELLKEIRKR